MIRNSRGVTAIELIGTVAIIGLLSSMAVPSVNNVILQYRLKQTAREIASNLKLLQIRAISTNSKTYLDLTPRDNLEGSFYSAFVEPILFEEEGVYTHTDTDATNLLFRDIIGDYKGKRLPSGVRFEYRGFTNNRVEFTPDGTIAQAGTIELINTLGNRYRVILAPNTGRIRIEK